MKTASIKEAKDSLPAQERTVEAGGRVIITRNGKPVADLVPHQQQTGLNFEALRKWKADRGVDRIVSFISEDFDDPLPEDFLITPGAY